MKNCIIRGIKAALAPLWEPDVIDLTRPGAATTPRERELLWQAGLAVSQIGIRPRGEVTAEERDWLYGRDPQHLLEAEGVAAGKVIRLSEYREKRRQRLEGLA